MENSKLRPSFQVSTDVVPIAEFKAQASQFLERIRENNQPILITQHGKAAAVILSPEEFDRLQKIQYERYVLTEIVHGQADALQGRTVSHEEVKAQLQERYAPQKKAVNK